MQHSSPRFFNPDDYDAVGDGIADDDTAFMACVNSAAAQTAGGVVVLGPTRRYKLGSNRTIPSTVTIFPMGGTIEPTSGKTITISGDVAPVPSKWIGGSGLVAFAHSSRVAFVYAEWWGGAAAATTGTATNQTSYLQTALATGKSVHLLTGVYGYTGGLDVNTVGQRLVGAGRSDGSFNRGTVLHKLSGTGYGVRVTQVENAVLDLTFDSNGLDGNTLSVYGAKHSQFARLSFRGQGGTSYALRLHHSSVVNLCSFSDLEFQDGNYGHIQIEDALYCSFFAIMCGSVSSGKAIDIGRSGGQAMDMKFFGLYVDGPISIHDNSGTIEFFGLGAEAITSDPVLTIAGTQVQGVLVQGFRMDRGASSVPVVEVASSAKNVVIRDIHWRDTGSSAGQHLIELDGAQSFTLDSGDVYCNNDCDLLECVGTRSDYVTVRSVYTHSGPTLGLIFKCAYLVVENCLGDITFATGGGNNDGTFIGCSGTLNTANAVAGTITLVNYQGTLTDTGMIACKVTYLTGSATFDPPSLSDGAGTTTTVTVTGASLGDFADASFSLDLQGLTATAWVSATNTVSVRFQNETGGTIDLGSGTLRARVRPQ